MQIRNLKGKRGVVQLQAADYLAYELSKFTREHQSIKADPSKFRASVGILPEPHDFYSLKSGRINTGFSTHTP